MEAEIIEKLIKIQDAHNGLGDLFGQIALSNLYIGLKELNKIYGQQNECINGLREAITQQRKEIRGLKPCTENLSSEPYKLDDILGRTQNILSKKRQI